MKKFNKIIAVFMSLLICSMSVSAFAAGANIPAETAVMMGDFNGDGRVSAVDARAVLRMAAKIDSDDGVEIASVDADNDGKISVADARLILRVAASLSSFTYGFDGQGNSNAVSLIQNGTFFVSAEVEGMNVIMAKSGKSVYISSDDLGDALGDTFSNAECGVFFSESTNDVYALLILENADTGVKSYLKIKVSEGGNSLYGGLDIPVDDLEQMSNIFSFLIADDIGTPVKVTENNVEYMCYSYTIDDVQYMLYTDISGMISRIDAVDDNDNVTTIMTINSLSYDIPDEYVNLDMYTEL